MTATVCTFKTGHAKSPIDRALSLFSDVRAGEGATAVLMLLADIYSH